jgi:hypothetical protein
MPKIVSVVQPIIWHLRLSTGKKEAAGAGGVAKISHPLKGVYDLSNRLLTGSSEP